MDTELEHREVKVRGMWTGRKADGSATDGPGEGEGGPGGGWWTSNCVPSGRHVKDRGCTWGGDKPGMSLGAGWLMLMGEETLK